MKQNFHGGRRGARRAVLLFESAKSKHVREARYRKLLKSITTEEVKKLEEEIEIPSFIDAVCGLIRRLEAAANMYQGQNRKEIRHAHRRLIKLLPKIKRAKARLNQLTVLYPLEELGKEIGIDSMDWAMQILKESLPAWGYK